jgi:leucyl-tRNA synthetase
MSRELTERAREFRKAPTRGEAILWELLRDRTLGVRIYRQKPIKPFIPDFVCERPKLIIEVDGPVHEQQPERDFERQRFLEAQGYRVIRVTADDAENNTESVVERICIVINELQKA